MKLARVPVAAAMLLVVPQLILLPRAWGASGPTPAQSAVVSAVPGANTPQVVDGEVLAFAEIGNTMLAGGSFTRVQNYARTVTSTRNRIVAWDKTTGAISTTFAPSFNGSVAALTPGPTAGTVYVGGAFTTLNGAAVPGIVLLDATTGARITSFAPGTMTTVNTIVRQGSQLLIGGEFRKVGTVNRGGLASLDPNTGALTGYLTASVTGNHNFGHVPPAEIAAFPVPGVAVAHGRTSVSRITINAQGTRMVIVGNFDSVSGLARDQIAVLNVGATSATVDPNWKTLRFSDSCFWFTYDGWIRDVDFSPDGSYFAVASAGGHDFLKAEKDTTCDTIARFETNGSGQAIEPTWVASSGSDSFFSVAITGTTVYGAGHPRWMNNPLASDGSGPGAVARPGIVALDPVNGIPLNWNPGREPRGHGTQALLATSTGLWIGSDTNYIGNKTYYRGRIAFFPLNGGAVPVSTSTAQLPATVYLAGSRAHPGVGLVARGFDGTVAGSDSPVTLPAGFTPGGGAVLIGSTLFYTKTDAMLYARTFNGSTFGPERSVNPYSDPKWDNVVDSGRGFNGVQVLKGIQPALYAALPTVSALAFDSTSHRLLYTFAGDPALYSAAFSPDSGITSPLPTVFTGVSMANVSGLVLSGGHLYLADKTTGELSVVNFDGSGFSGSPTVVSGPGTDGVDWSAGSLFVGQ